MKRLDRMSVLAWVLMAAITLLVSVFFLAPFWGTGGSFPYTQPGWVPNRPDEFASIARFRGTVWENNPLLNNLFWNIACYGWCLWLPALLFVGYEMRENWNYSSEAGRWWRLISMVLLAFFGVAWIIASWNLLTLIVSMD
jgi:hypothetical protein